MASKFLACCARAIALNPGILWFIMVVMELSQDQGGLSWVRRGAVLTFCEDLQMHQIGAARALHVLPKAQPRATQKNSKAHLAYAAGKGADGKGDAVDDDVSAGSAADTGAPE